MHTYAQTRKPLQKTIQDSSKRPGLGYAGQHREANPILTLQRTMGNQAVQRLLQGPVQRYSTEDCTQKDKKKIEESYKRAKAMIKKAIDRLEANPVTTKTKKHFANHFGAYAEWRRGIVLSKLKVVQKELDKSKMTFECESDSDGSGYTYWVFGDIHLGTRWLHSASLNERAETFIHETLHWKLGVLDLGYHKNNQDNDTSWPVAVNNADAYSELAQDLYEQP